MLRIVAVGTVVAATLVLAGAALLGGSASSTDDPAATAVTLPALTVPAPERVETYVAGTGERFTDLLARAGLGDHAPEILLETSLRANLSLNTPGLEVTVRRWAGDDRIRAVELRLDGDAALRFDPANGWSPVVVRPSGAEDTVLVAGQVRSGQDLYAAFLAGELEGMPTADRLPVVDALARIFEHRLDFTHDLHAGDRFRLLYERDERPDGSVRSRRILAAEIASGSHDYTAIYFRPGGGLRGDYFDADGRSLEGGLSRYPLDYIRITSAFAPRRYHPILGIYRAHRGTDFGAPRGTPVHATGDGVVSWAGPRGGYGNMIELRHADGYVTRYAHLSRISSAAHVGAHVSEGQVIGAVGATGLATGPHLHYEVLHDGVAADPARITLPSAPGVAGGDEATFREVAAERLAALHRDAAPAATVASVTGARPAS